PAPSHDPRSRTNTHRPLRCVDYVGQPTLALVQRLVIRLQKPVANQMSAQEPLERSHPSTTFPSPMTTHRCRWGDLLAPEPTKEKARISEAGVSGIPRAPPAEQRSAAGFAPVVVVARGPSAVASAPRNAVYVLIPTIALIGIRGRAPSPAPAPRRLRA